MKLCECCEDELVTHGRFCEECREAMDEIENPLDGEDLDDGEDDGD